MLGLNDFLSHLSGDEEIEAVVHSHPDFLSHLSGDEDAQYYWSDEYEFSKSPER